MASTQKKTANTKKQTTGKKPNGTRKKPPAYVPDLMARGIGAAVCLFLALMVVLGMVGIHAVVPDLLCRGIRGLVGYGFWLTALALFWAAGLLLLRRERRATLRLWCLGLLPVVGGAFLHVLLSPRQPSLGIDLASRLWNDGVYGFGGGVISGGLAVFGTMGFSRVGAGVIFALAFLALLAGAGHLTPPKVLRRTRPTMRRRTTRTTAIQGRKRRGKPPSLRAVFGPSTGGNGRLTCPWMTCPPPSSEPAPRPRRRGKSRPRRRPPRRRCCGKRRKSPPFSSRKAM